MKLYPNGIKDLVNAEKPRENEPRIILFFNAPLWFCKRYGTMKPQDSHHSKINIIREMQDLLKLNIPIHLNLTNDNKKNILFEDNEFASGLLELNDLKSKRDDSKIEAEINNRIELTDAIREIILNIFENFDTLSEELVHTLLEKYEYEKSVRLKEAKPDSYEKINKIYKKIKLDPDEDYTSLDYEDLMIIIARVINYYTRLNINIDFTFLEKTVIMSFWGGERQIDSLAEKMKYELKIKGYALKFQKVFNMVNDNK